MIGVKGLYPAVEHLRGAGEIGDLGDGQSGVADVAGRAAGADEFAARVGERAGEVNESCLVVEAE